MNLRHWYRQHEGAEILETNCSFQAGLRIAVRLCQSRRGKLKETGTTHWNSPNAAATNEYGFKALAGGSHDYHGNFVLLGEIGYYWTSTVSMADYAYDQYMGHLDGSLSFSNNIRQYALSVRCVKD